MSFHFEIPERFRLVELPIRLFGEDLIYVGTKDRKNGSIATQEQFDNFDTSFAQLVNGNIMRYGAIIGAAEEIEWREPA